MITINAKTKAVTNACEHEPQVYSEPNPYWAQLNITPGYIRGWCKPNFPMPAIPYQVIYGPDWLEIDNPNTMQWKAWFLED